MLFCGVSLLLLASPLTKAVILEGSFKLHAVNDIDIAAVGTNLGHLDLTTCNEECVARGASCVAFHRSSAGVCLLLIEEDEKAFAHKAGAPSAQLWRRILPNTRCSALDFPIKGRRSRYRFETTTKTWQEAVQACEAIDNGKLVELETAEEQLFLANALKSIPGTSSGYYVWIGLMQLPGSVEPAGGWVWYKSKQAFKGTWMSGQPANSGGNEHLGELYISSSSSVHGQMNDYHASSSYRLTSVCECDLI